MSLGNLEQLKKESDVFIWYNHLKLTLARDKKTPFRLFMYQSGVKRETLEVFVEDDVTGSIESRKKSADSADMIFLRQWFSNDFPDLDFVVITSNK